MFAALRVVAVAVVAIGGLFSGPVAAQSCPPLLNHTFAKLQDESPQPLCQYQGRVLLVVNTASYCGFTSQYDGLEKLHSRYAARGLTVLGFPSGDFGNQEKANNKEIADLLSVSPSTIETHRAHILQTLDVHSTADSVLYAVRRGIIS